MYLCGEDRAALQLYEYMTDNNISDERLRMADCQHKLGDSNKAIEILTSITDKSSGEYYSLGNAYEITGQYEKAEQCFLQALQIEYRNTSKEPVTDYYGNPRTTHCHIQDRVDLMSVASPEDRLIMITHITPDIIAYLVSLGDVYSLQKKYSTAEAYNMKSLQFIHDLYGDEAAVLPAANTLNSIANNYNDMGQNNKAADYYLQALTIFKQISHGVDNMDIANTLYNIALNYLGMESYNEAEDYYMQALAVFRQISQGADSVDIANTLLNLGVNYEAAGDNIKSREVWRQALDIYMRLDPQNPNIAKLDCVLQFC